jgi:SAM-dependent methyltransferase
MTWVKTILTLILAPLMALSFAVPGAWSQALPVEEVPFVATPDNVTLEMLGIAGVNASDYVMDLGSGDGRIVILAARRFGARGLGVELVPELVARSNASAQRAGVADRVTFREQDLFKTDLSVATVITMYLLPEVNMQLRPAILALKPGTRIVSHDWDMGDWKPDRTTVVEVPDKQIGQEKSSKVHLWVVPANVAGTWCGSGLLRGTQIKLEQQFQEFRGTLTRGERSRQFDGTVEGDSLRPSSKSAAKLGLKVQGNLLRIASAERNLALLQGASFTRTTAASCMS